MSVLNSLVFFNMNKLYNILINYRVKLFLKKRKVSIIK